MAQRQFDQGGLGRHTGRVRIVRASPYFGRGVYYVILYESWVNLTISGQLQWCQLKLWAVDSGQVNDIGHWTWHTPYRVGSCCPAAQTSLDRN